MRMYEVCYILYVYLGSMGIIIRPSSLLLGLPYNNRFLFDVIFLIVSLKLA